MIWDDWLRSWERHSKTLSFQRKLRLAMAALDKADQLKAKLFASVSGGKDSTALLAVMDEHGSLCQTDCVYAHTELGHPGTEEHVRELAEQMGLRVFMVRPELDGVELLRTLPDDRAKAFRKLLRHVGGANLCVTFAYERGYQGAYLGLRGAESRRRSIYADVFGAVYQHKVDGHWQVCPLLEWSANDSMAMVTSRGLPLHPYYRKAWEMGLTMSPGEGRIDLLVCSPELEDAGLPSQLAAVYPDRWEELCQARPALRQSTLIERSHPRTGS